jgi:hypothetical protein
MAQSVDVSLNFFSVSKRIVETVFDSMIFSFMDEQMMRRGRQTANKVRFLSSPARLTVQCTYRDHQVVRIYEAF